jgi:hypothetical protein
LCIEAQVQAPSQRLAQRIDESELRRLAALVSSFSEQYHSKVELWKEKINWLDKADQGTVIWGSGSKGITFLNIIELRDQIQYVVDINPRKHFKFVAGTGQQIVPPEFLKEYRPANVLILNPIYHSEIERNLAELGLDSKIILV